MPMFDYKCGDCGHRHSHFLLNAQDARVCPECSSANYQRQFSVFKSDVEYSNPQEFNARVVDPAVSDIYRKIGNEALDEDTKTLEDVFGPTKVSETLAPTDD